MSEGKVILSARGALRYAAHPAAYARRSPLSDEGPCHFTDQETNACLPGKENFNTLTAPLRTTFKARLCMAHKQFVAQVKVALREGTALLRLLQP
jgi:hypothetical protein